MGRRYLVIDDRMFPHFFGEGMRPYQVTADGIPRDAKAIDATMDRGSVLILLESEKWPDDPEGYEEVMRLTPTIKVIKS